MIVVVAAVAADDATKPNRFIFNDADMFIQSISLDSIDFEEARIHCVLASFYLRRDSSFEACQYLSPPIGLLLTVQK